MKRIELVVKGLSFNLRNECATNLDLDANELLEWAADEYAGMELVEFKVFDIDGKDRVIINRNSDDEKRLNALIK